MDLTKGQTFIFTLEFGPFLISLMRKTYRNGFHQVLICSLLTTLLKLTNMGRPSGWPWQLGTIIWAALAVLGQRACACGPREILTPNYSVCFVLPLVLSPPLVIPPRKATHRQNTYALALWKTEATYGAHHVVWVIISMANASRMPQDL